MGLPIGLDDEGRRTGHERRRFAGATRSLEAGGLAAQVVAVVEPRVRGAGGERSVSGGDQVHGAAALVEPAGAERADVVVQPAAGGEVPGGGVVGLGVELEL